MRRTTDPRTEVAVAMSRTADASADGMSRITDPYQSTEEPTP